MSVIKKASFRRALNSGVLGGTLGGTLGAGGGLGTGAANELSTVIGLQGPGGTAKQGSLQVGYEKGLQEGITKVATYIAHETQLPVEQIALELQEKIALAGLVNIGKGLWSGAKTMGQNAWGGAKTMASQFKDVGGVARDIYKNRMADGLGRMSSAGGALKGVGKNIRSSWQAGKAKLTPEQRSALLNVAGTGSLAGTMGAGYMAGKPIRKAIGMDKNPPMNNALGLGSFMLGSR